MTRVGSYSIAVMSLVWLATVPGAHAAAAAEPPDFKEVYELVRTHLTGVSEAELNRAAVSGLLEQLGPKVSLVRDLPGTYTKSQPVLVKCAVFDGPVGYLRIGWIDHGLARAVAAACEELARTNELTGLVLDLRHAGGRDYAEAGAVADLFLSKEQLLLSCGAEPVRSQAKTNAVKLPVAVLVNGRTESAAEALAAVLRETGVGLVIGANTAGRAMIAQEFPLKNGQRLCIATSGIKLRKGDLLSTRGVKPDIEVAVGMEAEQAYLADPFSEPRGSNLLAAATAASTNNVTTGTNRLPRHRFTEADLVRERREGADLEPTVSGLSAKGTELGRPEVRDPALARALDLIKGLAVVRRFQSP